MEIAQPVSEFVNAEKTKIRAMNEYKSLNMFTYYDTNTDVPGTSVVDASFVKTPFLEHNPMVG